MKNLKITLLIICSVALFTFGSVQNDNTEMATVYKESGVFVFVNSQPVKSYDVVFSVSVKNTITWTCPKGANDYKRMLLKKANKKDIKFDALIMNGDQTADAIVFKNE